MLIRAVFTMAGSGCYRALFALQRGEIHRLDVEEDHPGRHTIGAQVVNGDVDGEPVIGLDDSEGEAVPLQWIGRVEKEFANLGRGHPSEIRWRQGDALRIGNDVTKDLVVVAEAKPVVVGVVSPQVPIHGVRHRIDIADAADFPGPDAQPRDVAAAADLALVIPKMLRLLITHRGRMVLRFGCAPIGGRGGVPGYDGALGRPVLNRAQEHALPFVSQLATPVRMTLTAPRISCWPS